MTSARVVQEVPLERRTAVLKDPHEIAPREVVGRVLLDPVADAPISGGLLERLTDAVTRRFS